MSRPQPRISVFPKCFFDDLCSGRMDYLDWLRQSATLGAEGVEHYDGFFRSTDEAGVGPVVRVLKETGQASSLLCFSPDFTHPDPAERARQVERQKSAIDLCVRLGGRHCRTLSGQRHPGMTRREGVDRAVDAIRRSLDHAERRGVVLCLENHYKDGNWLYPEFAQPEDLFLEILERVDSPHLGVQYDPSNATVGGTTRCGSWSASSTGWCRCTPRTATWCPAPRWRSCARRTGPSATRTGCATARRGRG